MKTIFVIDDEEEICNFVEGIFAGNGYRVFKATKCEEAFILMNDILPDLIIMDIFMPKMSGIEFCKKIKKEFFIKDVPVIMMTGHDIEECKTDSYVSGASDYITKPFKMKELVSKVEAIL